MVDYVDIRDGLIDYARDINELDSKMRMQERVICALVDKFRVSQIQINEREWCRTEDKSVNIGVSEYSYGDVSEVIVKVIG